MTITPFAFLFFICFSMVSLSSLALDSRPSDHRAHEPQRPSGPRGHQDPTPASFDGRALAALAPRQLHTHMGKSGILMQWSLLVGKSHYFQFCLLSFSCESTFSEALHELLYFHLASFSEAFRMILDYNI